jgi:hypothetical protein
MLMLAISELRKTIDLHGETAADELAKSVRGQYVQLVIDEDVSNELVGSLATWLTEAGAIAVGLKY